MKNAQSGIRFGGISCVFFNFHFAEYSFLPSHALNDLQSFIQLRDNLLKEWHSICKLWYIQNLNYLINITDMVYWKYSASIRASTEYFDAEYEYDYLCFQWYAYEYESGN